MKEGSLPGREPIWRDRAYVLLALAVLPTGLIANLAYLVGAWADRREVDWPGVGWSMLSCTMWVAVAPVIIVLARRFRPTRSSRWIVLIFFTLLCFVLSIAVEVLFTGARVAVRTLAQVDTSLAQEWRAVFGTSSMTANVLLFFCTVAGVWAIEAARASREREQREAQLEARLSETRLQLLRMQLHPHFLFNALNAVSALVDSDPEAASAMLRKLEDFFRFSVEGGSRQEVPLSEELRFLESYLGIEKARFGERLRVEMDVDEASRELFVPALVLQPLVENAIRHGISPRLQHGCVRIRTRITDGRLVLTVEDDGVGLAGKGIREGIGIANTRRRLEYLYGASQELRLDACESGGVRVTVVIPAHSQSVLRAGEAAA